MRKAARWLVGTGFVAAVGYVAGLLSAPRSGKRTRKRLAKSASRGRIEAEKQLKQLHSELNKLLDDADGQLKKVKTKANKELTAQIASTKKTRQKVKLLLSALHNGDAADPDLKKTVAEA